jgi:hypothetical protein
MKKNNLHLHTEQCSGATRGTEVNSQDLNLDPGFPLLLWPYSKIGSFRISAITGNPFYIKEFRIIGEDSECFLIDLSRNLDGTFTPNLIHKTRLIEWSKQTEIDFFLD